MYIPIHICRLVQDQMTYIWVCVCVCVLLCENASTSINTSCFSEFMFNNCTIIFLCLLLCCDVCCECLFHKGILLIMIQQGPTLHITWKILFHFWYLGSLEQRENNKSVFAFYYYSCRAYDHDVTPCVCIAIWKLLVFLLFFVHKHKFEIIEDDAIFISFNRQTSRQVSVEPNQVYISSTLQISSSLHIYNLFQNICK